MDLRELRYFIAVAEEQNFGRAARKLNISQPPVTRQVRKLEDELGVQLFKRTSKGAVLTTAGSVFLEDVRQVMNLVTRSVERVKSAAQGELGTVEIAYFGSPSFRVVPEVLQSFKASFPDVDIHLRRMAKRDQVTALKAGRLHMGFGRYYAADSDLVIEDIATEGLAVAVPKYFDGVIDSTNWKDVFKAGKFVLFPEAGRPNFADEMLTLLQREGIDPDVSNVAEDIRSALILTAIGEGFTLAPNSVADLNWAGVKFFKLPDFDNECPVNCIYRKGDTSPILRALRASIHQHFE